MRPVYEQHRFEAQEDSLKCFDPFLCGFVIRSNNPMRTDRATSAISSAVSVYRDIDERPLAPTALRCLIAGRTREATAFVANALRRSVDDVQVTEATSGIAFHELLSSEDIEIALVDLALNGVRRDVLSEWTRQGPLRRMLVLLADQLAPDWPETAHALCAYDVHLQPSRTRQLKGLVAAHRCMRSTARTLLVDRSTRTRALVREFIENSRFPCVVEDTESGAFALEMAAAAPYDLGFISASVVHGEGLELACKLANLYPAMKVVFMDQTDRWTTERLARQFGFAAYLRRPFGDVEFEATMHRVHQLWRPYLLKALAASSSRREGARSAGRTASPAEAPLRGAA